MALQVVATSIQPHGYQAAIQTLADAFRAGSAIPFLGAGISRDSPAGLPMAGQLVPPLVEAFRCAFRSTFPWSSYALHELVKVRRILKNARMERLLDVLHQTHGRVTLEYLNCLRGERWNLNHACLAALSVAGCLPKCVTLNFDLLIEYAIAEGGGRCTTRCPLTGHEFSLGRDDSEAATILVKPHGSFLPRNEGREPLAALTATLSQVGTRPNFKNMRALDDFYTSGSTLLVAGYSDDDWDIFPILQSLEGRFTHIIWLKYQPGDKQALAYVGALLKEGALRIQEVGTDIPADPDFDPDPEFWALKTRVIPWLREIPTDCSLVIGQPSEILAHVCNILGLDTLQTACIPTASNIDPSPFWASAAHADDRNVRTLLALSALTRSSGQFARSLLLRLDAHSVIRQAPELRAQLEYHHAHTDHTDGYLLSAVRHMHRVVSIKQRTSPPAEYAGDLVWLGYEYLCLAKRPPADRGRYRRQQSNHLKLAVHIVTWIAFIPVWLIQGCWFLHAGVRKCRADRRRELHARARYYRADLLHNWGSYSFLLGRRWLRTLRLWFSLISWMYGRIETTAEGRELMSYDYYWMRHLEARLIAEGGVRADERSAIERKLHEIEHRNRLVQDHVQRGNTFAYQALLEFFSAGPDQDRTRALLDQAEDAWVRAGGSMASGRRRVALFRRLTGGLSFEKTIEAMLG